MKCHVLRTLVPLLWVVGATGPGCVSPSDDPSSVHDLRVLGMAFEPPELMAPDCSGLAGAIATYSVPVQLKALIQDPAGDGRAIDYDVSACANPDNRTCAEAPEHQITLDQGTLIPGDFVKTLAPGTALLGDGTPLLYQVFADDPFKGLGGLRMPVVLHLKVEDEEIYATKLMVFSCKFFPDSTANVTPQLPGLRLHEEPWPVDTTPTVQGTAEVALSPDPFDDLQEPYVVPSFSLAEVHLTESWRLSWFTTNGTISPTVTGGVDLGGQVGKHNVKWHPQHRDVPEDVDFFVVARDGRGGESWLHRKVHFEP